MKTQKKSKAKTKKVVVAKGKARKNRTRTKKPCNIEVRVNGKAISIPQATKKAVARVKVNTKETRNGFAGWLHRLSEKIKTK